MDDPTGALAVAAPHVSVIRSLFPLLIAGGGTLALLVAVVSERLMHRHRRPGVTYWQATLRTDGGWRRSDLFDDEGLRHQRRASRFGLTGAALWVFGLVAWALLRMATP